MQQLWFFEPTILSFLRKGSSRNPSTKISSFEIFFPLCRFPADFPCPRFSATKNFDTKFFLQKVTTSRPINNIRRIDCCLKKDDQFQCLLQMGQGQVIFNTFNYVYNASIERLSTTLLDFQVVERQSFNSNAHRCVIEIQVHNMVSRKWKHFYQRFT